MPEIKWLPVPSGLVGERADYAIAKLLGISRTKVVEIFEADGVRVAGRPVKRSDSLSDDMLLEVQLADPRPAFEMKPIDVAALKIVFQDEHMIVIDKPAGVAAHPSVGWDGPTVPEVLLSRGISLSTSGAEERQGIVQRLDVGTSGLMVLAKGERAYAVLKQAFRDRVVKKTYHALVQGHPDPAAGTIDSPIARSSRHDYKFTVSPLGKPSVTHFETIEVFPGATLLEIGLETGRTHQIRVHMSAFRHPLVGDPLYGSDPKLAERLGLDRQWLHAVRLQFAHPISQTEMSFDSEYPEDLAKALELLRYPELR